MRYVERLAPAVLKVFDHQSTMAIVGCVLAAQQASPFQGFWIELIFDLAGGHDVEKTRFKRVPFQTLFPIVREQGLIRRQFGRMLLGDAADGLQKKL